MLGYIEQHRVRSELNITRLLQEPLFHIDRHLHLVVHVGDTGVSGFETDLVWLHG